MKQFSKRLNNVIPGGCHTYSRGDDQFPVNAPPILHKGEGCYVWDPNDKKYLDYGMGLRSVTVGYADARINNAAIQAISNGNNLTRASTVELDAAEKLIGLVDNMDMVKFAKNGSNVTTAAVKLARAYTDRKYILRCKDHPFFSFDDWFIGNTQIKKGIPKEIYDLTLSFNFNDVQSVEKIVNFALFRNDIAAIILEPAPISRPSDTKHGNFLQYLRKVCDQHGIVLIFDEIVTGFRIHRVSAQDVYNVVPDLITFGKAMANGFSVAALCGKRDIMELGSIKNLGQQRTFLLSSTYGAEMCSLAAFLETMQTYEREGVYEHIRAYGKKLIKESNKVAESVGVKDYFYFGGFYQSPYYVSKGLNGDNCYKLRTIFNQEMINNGVMMPWVALSLSHGEKELDKTLDALEKSLKVYSKALEDPDKFIKNNVIKPVFRRYN